MTRKRLAHATRVLRGLEWLAAHGRAELDSDASNPGRLERNCAEDAIEWVRDLREVCARWDAFNVIALVPLIVKDIVQHGRATNEPREVQG